MIFLNYMVCPNHRYRKLMEVWEFKEVYSLLSWAKSKSPYKGYGLKKSSHYCGTLAMRWLINYPTQKIIRFK